MSDDEKREKPAEAVPLYPFPANGIPPRRWIIRNLIAPGNVTLDAAPSGFGKSTFSQQVALALAAGVPFAWWDAPREPIPVLILNAEDDRHEQQRRLAAAASVMGIKLTAEIGARIQTVNITGSMALFTQTEHPKTHAKVRQPTKLCLRLEELIDATGAQVVIIDPLIEAQDGFDENSNADMKALLVEIRTIARVHDVGILVVDHTRKGSQGEADDVRGGGSKVAVSRKTITLTRMTKDEAKAFGVPEQRAKRLIRVGDAKGNYTARDVDRWLEFVTVDLDNGDVAAALRTADDLRPVEVSSVKAWEHWAALVELVRCGTGDRPWAYSFQSKTARLDREMARRFKVPEKQAREIVQAAEERGALCMRKWTDPDRRKPVDVWAAADGAELSDEVTF